MNFNDPEILMWERAVNRLNHLYTQSIDDDRLEEWPELFEEDGRYIVNPRENRDLGLDGGYWMYYTSRGMMRDRVTALRHINVFNKHYYRHILGVPFIVGEDNGVVTARTNYMLVSANFEGKGRLLSAGEYIDQFKLIDGTATFIDKEVIPDNFHTPGAIIAPI